MSSTSRTLWPVYIAVLVLSFSQPGLAARKFITWFADSELIFRPISQGVCNASYNAYEAEYTRLGGAAWIDLGLGTKRPIYSLCRAHMSCIISNLTQATQASLASGQVVLGLLPTLLAVLSPSIAELALVSVHRPFLGTLISIGSPGVLQTRIFEYEDPAETLDLPDEYHGATRLALALGPWDRRMSTIISALEYAVVLASGINVIYLSIELGIRSICSWGCTRSWPPILWAIFPLVIYAIGAHGYRLTLDPATRHMSAPVILHHQGSFFTNPPPAPSGSSPASASRNDKSASSTTTTTTSTSTSTTTTNIPLLPLQSPPLPPDPVTMVTTTKTNRLWALILRELLPCAAHPDTVINNRVPLSSPTTRVKMGILLNCLAGFLSCMHLLYGTVVFASFNFVHIMDVISNIALRFLASSVACRLVILVEIAGMRGARMRMVANHGATNLGGYTNNLSNAGGGVLTTATTHGGNLKHYGSRGGGGRKRFGKF